MYSDKSDAPVYNGILERFDEGMPIKVIAREMNISEIKVRRVLITEGVWESPTSREVCDLFSKGMSAKDIADRLGKPVKTVQAYMPYTRGEYNDGEPSDKAIESRAYRRRKKDTLNRQVVNRKEEKKIFEIDHGIKEKVMEKVDISKWKEENGFSGNGHKVLKLHLELEMDLDDEEAAVLRKYGKSEKGISRDILVSEDMLLHNLHYAIQRAFGWQNSHLHRFAYPESVLQKLTEDSFPRWAKYCGLYFRYPDCDDGDIYWDDDYDVTKSPKMWLKEKYSAPYEYGGISEHYMYSQTRIREFIQGNPVLRIGPSFSEFMAGNKDSKVKKIEDTTVSELGPYFESTMDELLERLPIGQVLGLKESRDWEKKVNEIADKAGDSFACNYGKIDKELKRENYVGVHMLHLATNPDVIPLSDTLSYYYDYGDGWIVDISCTEIYESFDRYNRLFLSDPDQSLPSEEEIFDEQIPIDSKGHVTGGKMRDSIATVISKEKPVCIAADGLPVMDDAGGPWGYCAFLRGIHGEDGGNSPYDDKEESREWGRNMGWTGRMNRPENIL